MYSSCCSLLDRRNSGLQPDGGVLRLRGCQVQPKGCFGSDRLAAQLRRVDVDVNQQA